MNVIILKCTVCNRMLHAQYQKGPEGSYFIHVCTSKTCSQYWLAQKGDTVIIETRDEEPQSIDVIERKGDACKQQREAIVQNEQKIHVVMCEECGPVGVSDSILIADDICKGHRIINDDSHECCVTVVPFTVGSC